MKVSTRSFTGNKLVINGVWLYILQFYNMIIPLLTLPYITRILGSAEYGMFSFSLNLVTYFQVLVEYGFNFTGARKIALTKDKKEQSKLLSNILVSKLVLCLFSFLMVIFICMLVDFSEKQVRSIMILYLIVIGTSVQQFWLFHGLQLMKFVTILNVIARTLSVLLIFLTVNGPEDFYIYCLLHAITYLVGGILSVILIRYKLAIRFLWKISLKNVVKELKDGWYTFTTSAMSKLLGGIGITVLGFLNYNESVIGIYSAIQKIPILILMLFAPVGQAIFPHLSQKYSISFNNGKNFTKKVAKIVIPIVGFLCFILILCPESIVRTAFGDEYIIYSSLLIPFSVWIILGILNNFLGVQTLLASGHNKEYSRAFNLSMASVLLFNILFGINWGANGVAIAMVASEMVLTMTIIFQIKKLNRKYHHQI